jgi:8-oxo-dGTP pyrophosphatase MutT (NUDIX family)
MANREVIVVLMKRKVYAYITHGSNLLVFRHVDFPEAGIQVPGGSVEPDEEWEVAALREAEEETGLRDLRLVRLLGEVEFDRAAYGLDQIDLRRFYHLRCEGDPPATWRHSELTPSEGPPDPILFELFWAPLPDGVPPLVAAMDALLPELVRAMGDDPA